MDGRDGRHRRRTSQASAVHARLDPVTGALRDLLRPAQLAPAHLITGRRQAQACWRDVLLSGATLVLAALWNGPAPADRGADSLHGRVIAQVLVRPRA